MNKLNQLISQFSKILVVFLAGFILLVSTACNNTSPPQASSSGKTPNYDYYDANQPEQGGMNKYNDDSRLDNSKMEQKTDRAVNQSRANLQRGNDSLGEYADEVSKTGKVLGNIKDDAAQRTGRFGRDISEGAKRNIDTAKSNLDKASSNVGRAADDASDAVQDKLNDTARAARNAADPA